jgi:hypothetical protein
MSWRRLISKGPLALTAIVATFVATWRFSNRTVKADKQGNQEVKKMVFKEWEQGFSFEQWNLHTTMASASASRALGACVSSSAVWRATSITLRRAFN